ncbi:flagellar filament capping protein FliD [Clostridium sp. VAP41]|uniref:flagellar filament capping protein FliD n=1 Tax=Clostridium sp. VAP41 TaxID=2949979 RepID=UPI00207A4ABD|nr:flagellar filament capping protein FliD [Clostridium sp. VAP41]
MRITGLATGLDMDEIIKNSMKPYRIKVDQMTQKKDVTEIKQKLYRDIMSDATKFYDKYFDVAKSDSLLKVGSYKSVSFTSNNDAVKVTAGSGAKPGNYTVTGTAATAAKAVVDIKEFKDIEKEGQKYKQITVNGKEFDVKVDSERAMAEDLNKQLKNSGINVSVRYSQMAGTESGGTVTNKSGFIFESTVMGKDATFTIGGTATTLGNAVKGVDAKGANVIPTFTLQDIKNSKELWIDGEKIDFSSELADDTLVDSDIISIINKKIGSKNIKLSTDESNKIKFESTKVGVDSPEFKVSINGIDYEKSEKGTPATKSYVTLKKSDLNGIISIGGKTIEIGTNDVSELNKIFEKNGIEVTATVDGSDSNQIILTSKSAGTSSNFEVKSLTTGAALVTSGTDLDITIRDDKGGVFKPDVISSNTITIDDITFTFNGKIDGEVKITGKNDVTQTKDKLISFINDYNTFMEKLNTLTGTKHDKAYDPLTEDQKKEMSESEIKLWNERVEKGQLYKDSNLTRIANSLKSTMRTVMDGTGLNLEKIGIKPVQDYSGKLNGTFTIDEDKLTTALEDDIEGVMNLFIGNPADGDKTTSEYTSKTGIVHQLNDTLRKEFKTSSSSLSQKAGMEGMSTFGNNELTKSMSDYEKKIKDMEKDFSRREQALYSKYATLEKMMNNLNSQQSNLMSQLGMS